VTPGIRKPGGHIPRLKRAKSQQEKESSEKEENPIHFIP
jgi:hypothetical protein